MRINRGARLAPLRVNGMPNILSFIIRSVSLGLGLAMDAFSVSVTDGLKETNMSRARALFIAGIYGGFQFLMPLLGWGCVKLLEQAFTAFQPFVPWIALGLLLFLGGRMVREGLCLVGLRLGRYFGGKIVKQACILGGIILILVGGGDRLEPPLGKPVILRPLGRRIPLLERKAIS